MNIRQVLRSTVQTVAVLAAASMTVAAWAAQPWVSIPSAVSGGRLTITAGGLTPGQDVTVSVKDAHGQTQIQTFLADGNGALNASMNLATSGRHRASVVTGRGRTLARGDVLNLQ
ncbi:MAG: hypothetical protein L6Q73_11675 [Aquabacterium sp.]|nr:hypothetical protein [Aquabacterium sp.]